MKVYRSSQCTYELNKTHVVVLLAAVVAVHVVLAAVVAKVVSS